MSINPKKWVGKSSAKSNPPAFDLLRKEKYEKRLARVEAKLKKYFLNADKQNSTFFSGPVNSEGDKAHRVYDTRNAYGYQGEGVKIGVLSDSYNAKGGAATDSANDELPGAGNPNGNTTAVTVLNDDPSGADEGRAMLQIVHDLAPKAQLYFATADISEASFATNITNLRSTYHCDIVIDDVFYDDEPVFQDGILAKAVNTVTADGALYFSSAGNEGNVAKGTAGVFEGDFKDAGSPAFTFPGGTKSGTIHNFGTVASPVNGDVITSTGFGYTLNWTDPQGASTNDYDFFLVSSAGTVTASSTNIQNGTQNPFEIMGVSALATGDRLVVFKSSAAAVRAFSINTVRGTLTKATTGQIHGHNAAADAFSVAATPAATPFYNFTAPGPYPGAFSSSNQVEGFTSDGPRRVFYNANGTAITPNNFLFGTNGGTVRNKPDITAADGVSTTLPANGGLNPFYGTSAAAPHAGAIAALLKSAKPSLTASQIRSILTTTAVDIEKAGYDSISGFGIVQAYQAMQAVSPTPQSNVIIGNVITTEGAFSNGNGGIEPGETGNIVVQLTNSSSVAATNVTGVLTTSTPGVTITNGSVSYGTVNPSATVDNSSNPFKFGVNSSVACGTVINFTLTVTFGGSAESPKVMAIPVTLTNQPYLGISATLGSPASRTGVTTATGTQTGRLTRTGVASTCASTKANPGLAATTGSRVYDSYTFTNTNSTSQCITATLTSSNGVDLFFAAYNNSGFVPSNPSTNYLADAGSSGSPVSFSFNVAAGQKFTLVVHAVTAGDAVGSAYSLDVNLVGCSSAPPCTPVTITTASLSSGTRSTPYSQAINATGGSGYYSWSETGALPSGITLSGNTLSGTPTQSGSYPITIAVTDATGCPGTSKNYTLVISAGSVTTDYFRTRQSGNWNDAATWESATDAGFTAGVVSPATLAPDYTAGALTVRNAHTVTVTANLITDQTTVNAGGAVVVNPNVVLTLNDGAGTDLTVSSGGSMTIKSTASGTGMIGNSTTATVSGSVTVERYLSSLNNRAYRLLAPSVNTAGSSRPFIRDNWQEGANNPTTAVNNNPVPGYGTHITGNGTSGFDATVTGQRSLFLATPAGYQNINNTDATPLEAKSGYLIYIRGDRSIDLNSTASPLPSTNTTLRATGTLLTGTQTFAGTAGNTGPGTGFNLVTNPYASPISWASIYNANSGLNQFYTLFDPNLGGVQGAYVTVSTAGVKSNASSNATVNIQSGQAFFVQANSATAPTVTIQEAHKSTTNNADVFRTGSQTEIFTSSLFYTNAQGQRINADGVTSVYNNAYDTAVNGDDAEQIPNFDEDIAIRRSGHDLSIESRPLIDLKDTIPFAVARLQTGRPYEWQFTASNFNAPGLTALLVDRFTGSRSPLSLSGTTVVAFTVTSDAASSAANRFQVVFLQGVNTPLPLSGLTVKASQKEKDVEVEWTVQSEVNMDRYEVEKSGDARGFTKEATLRAASANGTATYNWLDVNASQGANYYRVKAVDKSGQEQYSRVVRVDVGRTVYGMAVYPNPVRDNTLSVSVNLPKGKYTLTLTNAVGQRVYQSELLHPGGAATQTLRLDAHLAEGTYQVSVSDGGENHFFQQLFKQ